MVITEERKHDMPYRATGPDHEFVAMDKFSCTIGTHGEKEETVKYKPLVFSKEHSKVESSCCFFLNEDANIKLSRTLCYFEKAVFDAVLTSWHRRVMFAGHDRSKPMAIDLNEIMCIVRNTDDVSEVSDSFRKSVIDALRRLRSTYIKLECRAEFKGRSKDPKKIFRCGTDASLLEIRLHTAEEIEKTDLRRSGDKICQVMLLAEPVLYTYAREIKHYEQLDPQKFQLPAGSISSARIARYSYVRDRVLLMQRTTSPDTTILFSEIEKTALGRDYHKESRKVRNDIREFVEKILDLFVQNGVIKGWEPEISDSKNGSTVITGVTIEPIVKKPAPKNVTRYLSCEDDSSDPIMYLDIDVSELPM